MPGYVLAIDGGSQSTKVSILDAGGRVRASARVALRPYASPGQDRWEHPEDDLWDTTAEAIRLALADFDGEPSEIVGAGLCSIRFCRAVLRADGTLAQPVMSWMDERVARAYEPEVPDAAFVVTASGYLAHRLTGERRDAAGATQGVWPVDTLTWDWSEDPEAYVRTGMPREMLFDLVEPGARLGCVSSEAAGATGLPEGLPVYATSNDKAVEALGAGLRSADEALLSLGTYVAAMTPGSDPGSGSERFWTNFGSEPDRYLYESAGVRRGMWTVSWFRDLVSSVAPGVSEAELNDGAEAVPAGAGGLLVALDWLAPTDEPWRRGAIVGFNGTQGRFHIYRAILEALAMTTADACTDMFADLGRELRGLVVTGGGAGSTLMLQILAVVYGVPVRTPAMRDAAGTGAAVCAAVGSGLYPDWESAVDAMVRTGMRVDPDPELAAAYAEVRAEYRRVLPRVRGLFAE